MQESSICRSVKMLPQKHLRLLASLSADGNNRSVVHGDLVAAEAADVVQIDQVALVRANELLFTQIDGNIVQLAIKRFLLFGRHDVDFSARADKIADVFQMDAVHTTLDLVLVGFFLLERLTRKANKALRQAAQGNGLNQIVKRLHLVPAKGHPTVCREKHNGTFAALAAKKFRHLQPSAFGKIHFRENNIVAIYIALHRTYQIHGTRTDGNLIFIFGKQNLV